MTFSDFIFDGKRLSDFGMFAGKFNDNSTDTIFSGGEMTFNTTKTPDSDILQFINSSYDSPISCQFDIFKEDGQELQQDEYSSIMRWLQRPDGYHLAQFVSDGYDDIYMNAQIKCSPIDVGRHVGFHITITNDSPYFYTQEIKKKFLFSGDNSFSFFDYSDKIGVILPYVKITIKEAGNLTLTNTEYDSTYSTVIKNCSVGDVIELFEDKTGVDGVGNPNNFNFIYPVICNKYDNQKNTFTCNLEADIEFVYRMLRMVTV